MSTMRLATQPRGTSLAALLLLSVLEATSSGQTQGSPSSQDGIVEQHIARARTSIASKKYKDAKNELKRALAVRKDSAEAHLLLARVSRLEGKRIDALKFVRRALVCDAKSAESHTLLAFLLFDVNDLNTAKTELTTALGLDPNSASALILQGDIEILALNNEKALTSFEKALELIPLYDPNLSFVRQRIEALRSYIGRSAPGKFGSFTWPVPLSRPRPEYTTDAKTSRIQGIVRLNVLVDENGVVTHQLARSRLGYGLDEQAQKAAAQIKFRPGMIEGRPVPLWVYVEVEFNLR